MECWNSGTDGPRLQALSPRHAGVLESTIALRLRQTRQLKMTVPRRPRRPSSLQPQSTFSGRCQQECEAPRRPHASALLRHDSYRSPATILVAVGVDEPYTSPALRHAPWLVTRPSPTS